MHQAGQGVIGWIRGAMVLLGVLGLAGCGAADPRLVSSLELDVRPHADPQSCGHAKARLSPDGSMIALLDERFAERYWDAAVLGHPWHVVDVIDTACFGDSGAWSGCGVGRIQSRSKLPISDAYWGAEGNLFVNINSSTLAASHVSARPRRLAALPVAMKLDPTTGPLLLVRGPVPSRDAEQEWRRREVLVETQRRIARGSRTTTRYANVLVQATGREVSAVAWPKGSLGIDVMLGAAESAAERLPQNIISLDGLHYLRPIEVFRGVDGAAWVIGGGDALRRRPDKYGEPRWQQSGGATGFGVRPVVDSATGGLMGLHTETDVHWLSSDTRFARLTQAVRRALGPAGVIHSLEVAGKGERAFAMIQDLSRGGVYSLFAWDETTRDWRSTTYVCASKDAVSDLRAETIDIGDPGWAVPARLYRRPGIRALAVFLHGGPGTSFVRDDYSHVTRDFLARGFDVVTFDYSGAVGARFDVANRISGNARAWLRDADIIARYLEGAAGDYDKVVLYASSFGAFIAPTVIERLDSRLEAIVLGVPWLKDRSPRERGERGADAALSELHRRDHQGLDEARVAELQRVMDAQQARMKPDERFLVYFGSTDRKSRPEDFTNRGKATIEIVAGGHEVSSSYEACWLESLCRPPKASR
jgi:pimeloyl-ACP methyl ester carboxylesterase